MGSEPQAAFGQAEWYESEANSLGYTAGYIAGYTVGRASGWDGTNLV